MPTLQTENFVIDILENDEELRIKVNKLVDGKEQTPLAYILGMNYLIFTKKRRHNATYQRTR